MDKILDKLNTISAARRLKNLQSILSDQDAAAEMVKQTNEVNNHVHTIYSFSPFSPTAAAYFAYKAGLKAVGIMDHDSISGAKEMLKAAALIPMASTIGCEIRVNFTGTSLEGRKINNPDSHNLGYIAIHGVPRQHISKLRNFLKPLNKARNKRNQAMLLKLNQELASYGLSPLDYKKDVYSLSAAADGGSITERHILFAFALKLITAYGKGMKLLDFLQNELKLNMPEKIREFLSDSQNPHYAYDLLGLLKSSFVSKFYIQPDDQECPPVKRAVDFANAICAIPAYAYLGDVGESPTGDKKAEEFEDSYLDELFAVITDLGFKAVTYMPPRNTIEQLLRIQKLCKEQNLMEISGVDINSSRQSFNCPEILKKEFEHLIDITWALIAHEKLASYSLKYSLFHNKNPISELPLPERIRLYSSIGQEIDHANPFQVKKLISKL